MHKDSYLGIIFCLSLISVMLAGFSLGIQWEKYQQELDHSQAKGQCYDTATKTRHLSKTDEGWICFIEHWEGKRKPRITMSRLTE
jgi:hypothetical protein